MTEEKDTDFQHMKDFVDHWHRNWSRFKKPGEEPETYMIRMLGFIEGRYGYRFDYETGRWAGEDEI